MGQQNSKPRRDTEILTEFHRGYSKIFSETTTDTCITTNDLLKIFPNRTLFCEKFRNWMTILSYKKTANKESFIFACEIFTLEGEKIISTAYKNHSFLFLDIFLHMCMQKLPNQISTVTLEDIQIFAETFANFFFQDDSKLLDLPSKIVDIVKNQTEIAKEPIFFNTVSKKFKSNIPFASSFGKDNFTKLLNKTSGFTLPDISSLTPDILTPTLLFLLSLNSSKILNRYKIEKLYSSSTSGYSFHKLVIAIKGYNAPILFIIRNKYNTIEKYF